MSINAVILSQQQGDCSYFFTIKCSIYDRILVWKEVLMSVWYLINMTRFYHCLRNESRNYCLFHFLFYRFGLGCGAWLQDNFYQNIYCISFGIIILICLIALSVLLTINMKIPPYQFELLLLSLKMQFGWVMFVKNMLNS